MSEDEIYNENLTTAEVAKKLRRHPRAIRDWLLKGIVTERGRVFLDGTKPGKSWLVHPD